MLLARSLRHQYVLRQRALDQVIKVAAALVPEWLVSCIDTSMEVSSGCRMLSISEDSNRSLEGIPRSGDCAFTMKLWTLLTAIAISPETLSGSMVRPRTIG